MQFEDLGFEFLNYILLTVERLLLSTMRTPVVLTMGSFSYTNSSFTKLLNYIKTRIVVYLKCKIVNIDQVLWKSNFIKFQM